MAKKNIRRRPHPAELPEGGEGGGGGVFHWPGYGPQELPVDFVATKAVSLLTREIGRLRARLHSVESQMLDVQFGTVIGGPNELPAPEIDSGGTGGVPRPRPDPELPVGPYVSHLVKDIGSLQAQMKALDTKFTRSFDALKQAISGLRQ